MNLPSVSLLNFISKFKKKKTNNNCCLGTFYEYYKPLYFYLLIRYHRYRLRLTSKFYRTKYKSFYRTKKCITNIFFFFSSHFLNLSYLNLHKVAPLYQWFFNTKCIFTHFSKCIRYSTCFHMNFKYKQI